LLRQRIEKTGNRAAGLVRCGGALLCHLMI
jgi:hypothetical protein